MISWAMHHLVEETTNDGDEKAHNHKTGFSPTTDPIRQQCKKEEEGAQTEADI